MPDTSILDFLIKSVAGILLAYIFNEVFKFKERIHDLEVKIDTISNKIDSANDKIECANDKIDNANSNGELNRIKENIVELKGMVHVLTCYQKLIRPPPGRQT
jgi:hypothetical protein